MAFTKLSTDYSPFCCIFYNDILFCRGVLNFASELEPGYSRMKGQ